MGVAALSVDSCASDKMKSMNDPMMHDSMMKEWGWTLLSIGVSRRNTLYSNQPSSGAAATRQSAHSLRS